MSDYYDSLYTKSTEEILKVLEEDKPLSLHFLLDKSFYDKREELTEKLLKLNPGISIELILKHRRKDLFFSCLKSFKENKYATEFIEHILVGACEGCFRGFVDVFLPIYIQFSDNINWYKLIFRTLQATFDKEDQSIILEYIMKHMKKLDIDRQTILRIDSLSEGFLEKYENLQREEEIPSIRKSDKSLELDKITFEKERDILYIACFPDIDKKFYIVQFWYNDLTNSILIGQNIPKQALNEILSLTKVFKGDMRKGLQYVQLMKDLREKNTSDLDIETQRNLLLSVLHYTPEKL